MPKSSKTAIKLIPVLVCVGAVVCYFYPIGAYTLPHFAQTWPGKARPEALRTEHKPSMFGAAVIKPRTEASRVGRKTCVLEFIQFLQNWKVRPDAPRAEPSAH